MSGQLTRFSLLIRDRDSKFTAPFDSVFASEGIRTIVTPVRTRLANAYAERFVRTIRRECLDWILIRNERHLAHVIREYLDHYNRERPTARSASDPQTRHRSPAQAQSNDSTASAASSTTTNEQPPEPKPSNGTLHLRARR